MATTTTDTLRELIRTAERAGLRICRTAGGRLIVKGPSSAAPLVERLRAHKAELLRLVPEGWPADEPVPAWWAELAEGVPKGFFRRAQRGRCLDPECAFGVAVQWADREGRLRWSCPKCGLQSGCLPTPKPGQPTATCRKCPQGCQVPARGAGNGPSGRSGRKSEATRGP